MLSDVNRFAPHVVRGTMIAAISQRR